MEFSLSTIILSGIFITAMVLPFWLISASIRKKKQQMKSQLEKFCFQNAVNLDDQEIWGMNAIAIDRAKRKLAFIRKGNKDQELITDLNQIVSCKIEKGTVGKPDTESYKIIKVDLVLRYKGEAIKNQIIPVFDVLYDDPVEGNFHHLLAKRWLSKIEEAIKPTTRTRRAA